MVVVSDVKWETVANAEVVVGVVERPRQKLDDVLRVAGVESAEVSKRGASYIASGVSQRLHEMEVGRTGRDGPWWPRMAKDRPLALGLAQDKTIHHHHLCNDAARGS